MANLVPFDGEDGLTLYANIHKITTSVTVYYPTGTTFETFGTSSRDKTDYVLTCTQQGTSSVFTIDLDDVTSGLTDGRYVVYVYDQAGGSPASSDSEYRQFQIGVINGDEVTLDTLETVTNTIDTKIGSPVALDSGSATIAGNLTKLADDNGGADFDATQDSLHALQGTVVAGVPTQELSTAGTVTTGIVDSGDYTYTHSGNDVYYQISPTGAAPADVYLTFNIGTKSASSVFINGRYDAIPGAYTNVYAYNYVADDWELISDSATRMNNSSTDQDYGFPLFNSKHKKSDGEVRIRFLSSRDTTTDDLYLDFVYVSAVTASASPSEIADAVYLRMKYVVYGEAIWIDTTNGTSGTDVGTHGIPGAPVDNLADAITLAGLVGVRKFRICGSSSIVLNQSFTSWYFIDDGSSTIDMNGQTLTNSTFERCTLTGDAGGSPFIIYECYLDAVTNFAGTIGYSFFKNTIGVAEGDIYMFQCASAVPGNATPSITFESSNSTGVSFRDYSGGMEVEAMGSNHTMSYDCSAGQLVLNANCTGGTIRRAGMQRLTDNSGNVTVTDGYGMTINTDSSENVVVASESIILIVDAVWDESLTAATHNVPTSAGRRLRDLSSSVILTGTAVSAGTNGNQIQLDTDASTVDGTYDPSVIYISSGTGADQCRLILEYDGSSRIATVDRDWKVLPDDTSEYVIVAHPGREHVNEGLAQAGSSNTITLNSLASSQDNAYNGQIIFIRSGVGSDQVGRIIAYNGTTKVATVRENWDIVPDDTSAYVMIPCGAKDTLEYLNMVDVFSTMVESDGPEYKYTANSLEEGPVADLSTVDGKIDTIINTLPSETHFQALVAWGIGDVTYNSGTGKYEVFHPDDAVTPAFTYVLDEDGPTYKEVTI